MLYEAESGCHRALVDALASRMEQGLWKVLTEARYLPALPCLTICPFLWKGRSSRIPRLHRER